MKKHLTSNQVKEMSEESQDVNVIRSTMLKSQSYPNKPLAKGCMQARGSRINCTFTGKTHSKRKEDCPARGKNCVDCGEKNHFIVSCPNTKSRKQHKSVIQTIDSRQYFDDASSDSDDYTLLVESIDSVSIKSSPKNNLPRCCLIIPQ